MPGPVDRHSRRSHTLAIIVFVAVCVFGYLFLADLFREPKKDTTAVPPGDAPHETMPPQQSYRDRLRDGTLGPEMVVVPGGCFQMGSEASESGHDEDENRHEVCVDGFAIGRYEITVQEFFRFVMATGYRTDAQVGTDGMRGCYTRNEQGVEVRENTAHWLNLNARQANLDTHPVACVSWNDAMAYVEWLNAQSGGAYRLPTEAEWEFAARSGGEWPWVWGEDAADACLFANIGEELRRSDAVSGAAPSSCSDGFPYVAPVGSFPSNPYGVHDMAGNVSEWTCSAYEGDYDGDEKRCGDRAHEHAIRGGSWGAGLWRARVAGRSGLDPTQRYSDLGFRLAHEVPQTAMARESQRLEALRQQLESQHIAVLLGRAEADMEALRLTTPEGNNAYERYREVLSLDPDNASAAQGVARVGEKYLELAARAIDAGRHAGAAGYLDKAASVGADPAAVARARERIAATRLASSAALPRGEAEGAPGGGQARRPGGEGSSRRSMPIVRDRLADGSAGPEMVRLASGCFQMGSPATETGHANQERQHRVCLDAFAIGRYEVTFEEYDLFARATGRSLPGDNGWGRGRLPVIGVDWNDAVAYADWLSAHTGVSYRLPSEAEWEYAARAGTSTSYWWGEKIGRNRANCSGCGGAGVGRSTTPVGSFAPNPWGLHDTAGNVQEWTCSSYAGDYSGSESRCEERARQRVFRGGAWDSDPWGLRSAIRYGGIPLSRSGSRGFRLARDVQ
jgi:formylglycine-generating enzyme required for sulfatase activity